MEHAVSIERGWSQFRRITFKWQILAGQFRVDFSLAKVSGKIVPRFSSASSPPRLLQRGISFLTETALRYIPSAVDRPLFRATSRSRRGVSDRPERRRLLAPRITNRPKSPNRPQATGSAARAAPRNARIRPCRSSFSPASPTRPPASTPDTEVFTATAAATAAVTGTAWVMAWRTHLRSHTRRTLHLQPVTPIRTR